MVKGLGCKAMAALAWLLVALCIAASAASTEDLVITKADRRVDLTSQVVRTSVSLKIENTGSKPVTEVLFALPRQTSDKISFLVATTGSGKGKNKVQPVNLPIVPTESQENAAFYKITLQKPLEAGQMTDVNVYYVQTHALKPFPEEIKQSEFQFVLYKDSPYILSPYKVNHQTSLFKVPTARVESYTKVDPVKFSDKDKEIKYGAYHDVAPMTFSELTIHYENNRPFAVVELLEQEIEISHWGNIYVTENYHLKHEGAHLKGSFSRLDYQARGVGAAASLRQVIAKLPPRAHSIYYRDEIGNISTSHVRSEPQQTLVEIEPRFPLFGGWQVKFTLGYSVPLKDFVYLGPDGRRYLNFPFGASISDVVVNRLVVKVVLPEGSRDASVSSAFPVDIHHEVKHTYLDTFGRPVVVLTKENVVSEHTVPFQVSYKFNTLAMLAEPMMLIFGFFCFFLACMAYLHFDFPISKSSGSYQARVQQEEMLAFLQRLQKVIKRRLSEAEKLETAMRDLARTGDVAACKAIRKQADAAFKETSKEVKAIYESLQASSRSSTINAKVDSLILKEKEKQEKLFQKLNLSVDLYERKMSSKDIDARLAPVETKYSQLKQEVAEILDSLDD